MLTKILQKNLILKTKFPVKIRDIHKIEKKNSINNSIFGDQQKVKYPTYMSKNIVKINMLIFFDKRRKQKTVCSYQRFQHIHVLLHNTPWKRTFCCYCLQAFKINYKQRTKMLKNGEYVRIKNYETSTFEWMLKDIKIEKIISVQILATIFFWRFQLY